MTLNEIIKIVEEKKLNEDRFKEIPSGDKDWPTDQPHIPPALSSDEVIVFDKNAVYKVFGSYAHGIDSHIFRHFFEFRLEFFKTMLNKARDIIKDADEAYIMDQNDNKVPYEDDSQITLGNVLNCLDYINDKVKVYKMELNETEQNLKDEVIETMRIQFESDMSKIQVNAVDIKGKTPENIEYLIIEKKIIKYQATSEGYVRTYYLNFENSGLYILANKITVIGFHRLDKQGNDIEKIKRRLNRESYNIPDNLKEALKHV